MRSASELSKIQNSAYALACSAHRGWIGLEIVLNEHNLVALKVDFCFQHFCAMPLKSL